MAAILSRPQCVSMQQSNSPTQIRLFVFNTYPSEHPYFKHDLLKLLMKLDFTLPGTAKHGQCAPMCMVYFWNYDTRSFFVIALLCIKWCLLICNLWKIDVLNIPNLRTDVFFFKIRMNSNSMLQCPVTEHSSQCWYRSDVVFYRFVSKLLGLYRSHQSIVPMCWFWVVMMKRISYFIVDLHEIYEATLPRL